MVGWEDELQRWLKPFLHRLGHKIRQRMCPLYVGRAKLDLLQARLIGEL